MSETNELPPVLVDTRWLRTLPKELHGIACAECDKTQAKFVMVEPTEDPEAKLDALPVCSICYLYDSPWGIKFEDAISKLIRAVEDRNDRPFFVTKTMRLMFADDADKILGSVCMASSIAEAEMERRARAAASGEGIPEILAREKAEMEARVAELEAEQETKG